MISNEKTDTDCHGPAHEPPPSRFRISPQRLREIANDPKTKELAAHARFRTRLRELVEDPETRQYLDTAIEPEEILRVIAKHWRRRYDEEAPGGRSRGASWRM